jgi:hypothetical protein
MKFTRVQITGNAAQVVPMPADCTQHNIQVTCTASGSRSVPSTGTLKVEVKQPYATEFEEVSGSPIALTDATKWLAFFGNVVADEIRFTVASIEAGHSTNIAIASHKASRGT